MDEKAKEAIYKFAAGLRGTVDDGPSTYAKLEMRDGHQVESTKAFLDGLAEEASKLTGAQWDFQYGSTRYIQETNLTSIKAVPHRNSAAMHPIEIRFTEHWTEFSDPAFDKCDRSLESVYAKLAEKFQKLIEGR